LSAFALVIKTLNKKATYYKVTKYNFDEHYQKLDENVHFYIFS